MNFRALRCKTILFLSIAVLFGSFQLKAQTCQPTETYLCLSLTPNSNVLTTLPEVLYVRNHEDITIHLSSVSPLEQCKLTGATFTSQPPASAAQAAVTAIMGIAPFSVGGRNGLPQLPSCPNPSTTDPAVVQINSAITLQNKVLGEAQDLVAAQARLQKTDIQTASQYSIFSVTDYRTRGQAFAKDYKALSDNLNRSQEILPGEIGYTGAPLIIDVQSQLDQAKSIIGNVHNTYDKDPKELANLTCAYASSDKLQSEATQYLTLINANDTALKALQTSLATLKLAIDQLKSTMGSQDETVDLPIPSAKNGTLTGNLTCINRLNNATVTLDPMPYTVVYQKVPRLSFSTGILFSPIQKQIYGTNIVEYPNNPSVPPTVPPTPVTALTEVALTGSSPFQVVPFSFLSLRLGPGWSYRPKLSTGGVPAEGLYGSHPKMARYLSKHVFAGGITGGFGVNPNSGSADPEYFAGLFGSVDRLMLHLGADAGQIETLGGGFSLGDVVPTGTTIPTETHFVWKLSAAIGVRLYP